MKIENMMDFNMVLPTRPKRRDKQPRADTRYVPATNAKEVRA